MSSTVGPDLRLSQLRELEAQSVHIVREVAAEFRAPGAALLGRQGLDRTAPAGRDGLPPGRIPFPVMHVDNGPYEAPADPELVLHPKEETVEAAVGRLLERLG